MPTGEPTELLEPDKSTVRRQLTLLLTIGWVTVLASLGVEMLWAFPPLVDTLSWGFPNHPVFYSIMRAISDVQLFVEVAIPLVAVLLPASSLWPRLVATKRRVAVGLWVAWLVLGTPSWFLLLREIARAATEEDLGLGVLIVIGGPVVLAALLAITVVSILAWGRWRARLTTASRQNAGS